jgi:glycolate oxidase FAD binding subunit
MIDASSETQIVDAVRHARARRTPFEIVGAGSKRAFGRPSQPGVELLRVSALKGVVAYEPEELIITVLPGTPVSEIESLLATKGQRLGFDPPDWGPLFGAASAIGTIGGAISADISGPARIRFGAVRDQLLGMRAVNGFGEAFKAGGKVVKNVTGFDIPKLICGAFGTLCVLTEVTLRVFPKPSHVRALRIDDMPPQDGLALLRRIWASPLEPTGLAYADGSAFVRLEGEAGPLNEKVAMLQNLCGSHEVRPAEQTMFTQIANGDEFVSSAECIWRVALPPSRAAEAVSQIGSTRWAGDCAGGIVWLATDDHRRVRLIAKQAGGHAILMRAGQNLQTAIDVFEVEDRVRSQLTRSVKAAFDPLGLFNPGRMWAGL